MLPAVLVPVGVHHGEDEHGELVQEGVVLPVGLDHAVDQVGHGGGTDPLPGVDASVNENCRFISVSVTNSDNFQGPSFKRSSNFSDLHLVAKVDGEAVKPIVDDVETLITFPVHSSWCTWRLA